MPTVDFEQRWAVIEAFIDAEAVNPDPIVVDKLRELVRFGELPDLSGPEMGLPAAPGSAGTSPAGVKKLVFGSVKSAKEAYDLMEDLAEEMLLEP